MPQSRHSCLGAISIEQNAIKANMLITNELTNKIRSLINIRLITYRFIIISDGQSVSLDISNDRNMLIVAMFNRIFLLDTNLNDFLYGVVLSTIKLLQRFKTQCHSHFTIQQVIAAYFSVAIQVYVTMALGQRYFWL